MAAIIKDLIYETSTRQYNLFCDEVKYWLNKLNLLNFETFIRHEELEDRAMITFNGEDGLAVITLSTVWFNIEPTDLQIAKTAFHEVMELLLGNMTWGLLDQNKSESYVNAKVHSVIRTLENTIFKEDWAGRVKPKKKKVRS
jgi:hypothetical protein